MMLYIANRQENIFAYEAYFLAFRIPFGLCWDVLIFSPLYSFL